MPPKICSYRYPKKITFAIFKISDGPKCLKIYTEIIILIISRIPQDIAGLRYFTRNKSDHRCLVQWVKHQNYGHVRPSNLQWNFFLRLLQDFCWFLPILFTRGNLSFVRFPFQTFVKYGGQLVLYQMEIRVVWHSSYRNFCIILKFEYVILCFEQYNHTNCSSVASDPRQ